MKLTTALRTPYRSRTLVPSGALGRVSETSLRQGIVAAQVVLATLCAARASTDGLHGHATIEGAVALVLLIAFTMALAVEAIGRRTSRPTPMPVDTPYRSCGGHGLGGGDGRSD